MSTRFRHVFGPVPSRRLGRSLGIDLVPYKTCTYDCVYCQLGRTRNKTVELREYVPTDRVLAELQTALASDLHPDWITLSGSGEPTLHARIGEVIGLARQLTRVPVAVLTNGSLLWDDRVRRGLAGADLVIPSLDAADAGMFRRVNCPHEALSLDLVLEGLAAFRREFTGAIWLEVFLVEGVNDTDRHVEELAKVGRRLAPDRIDLNTVARPPADSTARAVPRETLERLARRFEPTARVVAEHREAGAAHPPGAGEETLLGLLARRPCSLEDVSLALGLAAPEALKYLESAVHDGRVTVVSQGGELFYTRAPAGRP